MRIKKYLSYLFLILISVGMLCGCSAPGFAQTDALPKLVIGSDNYRPYNYIDENSEPAGIDVELAKEACRRMGYTPVFKQINWDEKDALLEAGTVDCLWGSFSMNGREEKYLWAGPYMYSRQVVAVLKDSDIQTLSDLKNKRIAVQSSSKPEEIFSKRTNDQIPKVKNIYCLLDMDEVVSALRKDYVDACAGHAEALAELLQNIGGSYRFLEEDLIRSELGVAFSATGDSQLRDRLNETLIEMREDGTVQKILESYGLDTEKALGGIAE